MKYIDADLLKEEFQKRFDICKRVSEDDRNTLDTRDWYRGKYTAYSECLSHIASLQQEQPRVDLEKEIKNERSILLDLFGPMNGEQSLAISNLARHFYELGLKARKEE